MNAATAIIQIHHEATSTDGGLAFCIDYLTISLSTAAVFLIRLHKTPNATGLNSGVTAHYLKMAVASLENSDQSETKLGVYLARTIREISRAAGFEDFKAEEGEERDVA